jgi:hypothetical protein
MDVKKLDDVLQRIARIKAPSTEALAASLAAIKPLLDLQTALAADPSAEISSSRGLEQILSVLRDHVANEQAQATREFYENVLSTVARLKG